MKIRSATAILAGFLFTAPSIAIVPLSAAPSGTTAKPVIGNMKGVVKSVNGTNLVVAIDKKSDETFELTDSTTRQGDIASGATVDVKYYMDGSHRVATAVTAKGSKESTAKAGN